MNRDSLLSSRSWHQMSNPLEKQYLLDVRKKKDQLLTRLKVMLQISVDDANSSLSVPIESLKHFSYKCNVFFTNSEYILYLEKFR